MHDRDDAEGGRVADPGADAYASGWVKRVVRNLAWAVVIKAIVFHLSRFNIHGKPLNSQKISCRLRELPPAFVVPPKMKIFSSADARP